MIFLASITFLGIFRFLGLGEELMGIDLLVAEAVWLRNLLVRSRRMETDTGESDLDQLLLILESCDPTKAW